MLARALQAAESGAREAEVRFGEARSRRQTATTEAEAATVARALAATRLEDAARAAGFPDLDAYRSALLDQEALDGLEASVKSERERRRSAEDHAERCRGEAAGIAPPDLATLLAAEAEAERALGEAREAIGARRREVQGLEALAAKLAEVAPKRADLERRYGVIGRLAQVANGTAGGYKVTFQRFVLGALLDEVLDAASQRLKVMSQGRYLLRRLDPEVAGGHRGRVAGLDLEVDDAWTGRTRHVATLSGGEGFLAALALALGLADVVQARAGGRRLDTLFVDEGFGALDGDALDLAMRALTDLQRDGRLVGIVSHVPELRERIDVRLEVTKGERGSHARFRLP